MASIGSGGWRSRIGIGLLVLASPLFLAVAWMVLVGFPWDVVIGLRELFSGRDVVQVADGEETGVTLFLLLLAAWGACWLLRLRLPLGAALMAALYGAMLAVPIIAVLGVSAEYGLEAVLARRGYSYCTFHVTSTGKGEGGTYVYVRDGLPDACDVARARFPAHRLVPGQLEAFDLPAR
jgi:hypothetical protein